MKRLLSNRDERLAALTLLAVVLFNVYRLAIA